MLPVVAQQPEEKKKAAVVVPQAAPAPTVTITIPQPFVMKSEGGNVTPWWLEYVKTVPTAVVTAIFTLGGVLMTQRHGLSVLEKQQAHADRVKRREMQWSLSERIVTEMATLVTTEINCELANESGKRVKKHLEDYSERLAKFMVVTELAPIVLSKEASLILKSLLGELADDANVDGGHVVTQQYLERFQSQIRSDLEFS
ncbi:MAG: hypothetical protein ACKV2U_19840 [Bryobacteraceae bacterium]